MKKIAIIVGMLGISLAINAQAIPKWKITDVVDQYSRNNDSVYVINFWATFCKPCVGEIPFMQALTTKYADRKVKLVLVSLDLASYYPDKIKQFAKNNNYSASIGWLNETDADYFCNMIDKEWSGSIPATLLVNNARKYRKFIEAPLTEIEFEKELKLAVGE